MALSLLDDEEAKTGISGEPLSLETDSDTDGWWEAVPVINYAVAERERWLQKNRETMEPGTAVVVRYTGHDSDREDSDHANGTPIG